MKIIENSSAFFSFSFDDVQMISLELKSIYLQKFLSIVSQRLLEINKTLTFFLIKFNLKLWLIKIVIMCHILCSP